MGETAPGFTLPDQGGEPVTLSDLRGKRVLVYFYPRDDTPGCTTQACGIRDAWPEFENVGNVVVLGISPDDEASHVRFRDEQRLPFSLLADPERKAIEAYGVWVEKSMYGRRYMGVERSSFLIDAEGKIAAVWRKVKPATHAELVLEALR